MSQSEFIVYFDECGDHGLASIDPTFPVFVLCACVFRIKNYLKDDLKNFSKIKFDHFGHDSVVFHSREIRKRLGLFQILADPAKRVQFMSDVASYFGGTTMTLIAAVIHKDKLLNTYSQPANPYSLSLLFCLERLYLFLRDNGETGATLYCIFEKRGDKEDRELAIQFERICAGSNMCGPLPFRMIFASKLANMPGLQTADLAAYPIAKYAMDKKAANQAFKALRARFRCSPGGKIEGWGIKFFP